MYIAFYKYQHGNWQDKLVAWFTGSRYSHVEMVFDNGDCISSSLRDDGVRVKKIRMADEKWLLLRLNVTKRQEQKMRLWLAHRIGASYDFKGLLLSHVFPLGMHDKQNFFCSELLTLALQYAQVVDVSIDANEVSPQLLLEMLEEKRLYDAFGYD